MTCLRFVAAAVVACMIVGAQVNAPVRDVHGNVLTSRNDPAVRITLPQDVSYVGGDRWVLYGVADCEVHVFVEADRKKTVQRLYWLQFEEFLPSQPASRYGYPFSRTMNFDGIDFDVRVRFGSTNEPVKPGSDLERVNALIQTKGYRLPPEMMNVRLVHLPDRSKRKELMIIYSEDLQPTGLNVAELLPGATAEHQWPLIANNLIQRAKKNITLRNLVRH